MFTAGKNAALLLYFGLLIECAENRFRLLHTSSLYNVLFFGFILIHTKFNNVTAVFFRFMQQIL